VPEAAGAFYFFLKVRTSLPAMELAENLIREHRIAVIPGMAFGVNEGCYLRIAYGALTPSSAAEGLTRLVSGMRALLG
jgi:aspartate/methionine/tyrosine aminotransferase